MKRASNTIALLAIIILLAELSSACARHYDYKTEYIKLYKYEKHDGFHASVLQDNWLKEKLGETDAETNATCVNRECLALNLIHSYKEGANTEFYMMTLLYHGGEGLFLGENVQTTLVVDGVAVDLAPVLFSRETDWVGELFVDSADYLVIKDVLDGIARAQSVEVKLFGKEREVTRLLDAVNKENIRRFVTETHVPNATELFGKFVTGEPSSPPDEEKEPEDEKM
ncbi:MAG: hypothetical protein C4523_19695 [Myxococcales bacterium]|nr:MAG: hypothetical protein C4523_19695 [Myxococcales bacterium]